jgi:gamma-glutamylaminecyclotransferase
VPDVRLFVYGSLRRGGANHRELAGATYVRSLATEQRYALVERDGYPALIPGYCAVEGELYELTHAHLLRLDAFEGSGYVRAKVTLADGSDALAYWLAGDAR